MVTTFFLSTANADVTDSSSETSGAALNSSRSGLVRLARLLARQAANDAINAPKNATNPHGIPELAEVAP